MENKLRKVEITQLERVVNESGLAIQEGEEIKQSYMPYLNQLAEVQSQATKINFENPTRLDEEIAGKLRKATVKIRTGSGELKDQRKKTYLLRGNLEQAAYSLIAASCKLAEDTFLQVEKAREIAEAKKRAELKIIRENEISEYSEFVPFGIDFGAMDETSYLNIFNGARLQYFAKIAEAERIENERIAKVKAGEEARLKMIAENERLRKENEAKEKQRLFEQKQAADLAEKERQIAAAKQKEIEDKARREREIAAAKLADEQARAKAAAEKAAAEKDKLEAELRAKKEAEDKAEAERIAAEKKAAAAPDREKIINAVNLISFDIPACQSEQMQAIANTINARFEAFKKWAIEQTNSL